MKSRVTKSNILKRTLTIIIIAILVYLINQDLDPIIEKIKRLWL